MMMMVCEKRKANLEYGRDTPHVDDSRAEKLSEARIETQHWYSENERQQEKLQQEIA